MHGCLVKKFSTKRIDNDSLFFIHVFFFSQLALSAASFCDSLIRLKQSTKKRFEIRIFGPTKICLPLKPK